MPRGFCSIAHCTAPALEEQRVGIPVACFCELHLVWFDDSPEAARVQALASGAHDAAPVHQVLVAALSDYRTRVELEHQRDGDPLVRAARGEKPVSPFRPCTLKGGADYPGRNT